MARKKNPAAVALGKKSVAARMKNLTPEERSEIARNAARSRWKKGITLYSDGNPEELLKSSHDGDPPKKSS